MALKDELQDAGYHVLNLTSRHQEALQAAKDSRPSLALVNINLRGPDDGIALARDLKALGIPSLFISGQINRARSAQSAAIGSMPKPYSTNDMLAAVTFLFGRMNGEASLPCPSGLELFDNALEEALPII